MEHLTMHSVDGVTQNVERIAALFPNCVTERRGENGYVERAIDFDMLRQELSRDIIDTGEERYQFTWPGKREAIRLANSPIAATLRPIRESSVDFDTTQNLYIEGDNLEVLKLLRENYLGKVKIIYIDPPYNTGKDFIYKDNFTKDLAEYLAQSGQFDEYGNHLFTNTEANGRFHTDWLNFIYPRVKISRDLMTDDGLLFISIGEHEISNLKRILVDIFGEDHFIETYIWESTFRPDNSSKVMRRNAEYVLCVAKNLKAIAALKGLTKPKEGLPSLTKSSMKESVLFFRANVVKTFLPDGIYHAGIKDSYELLNDVEVKDGIIISDFRLKGHVIWGQQNLDLEIENGTEIIIKSDTFVPYTKKPGDSVMAPTKLIPTQIVGDVLSANTEMSALFDEKVFSYPKPVTLIEYLLGYSEDKELIVLDFFSGSATTAQAVLKYNALNKTNRHYILVQLPEDLDENFKSASDKEKVVIENAIALCDQNHVKHEITEVAKERIRRAGKKIKAEHPEAKDLDIGFRVLRLDSSNMEDVYYTPDKFDEANLFNMVDNVKTDRSEEDLLFQVMLELDVPLSAAIKSEQLAGKNVFVVADGHLIATFDKDVNESTVTEIAKRKPNFFVMRDASAANDNVLDNFEQIFRHYSPDTVCKIL